MPLIAKAHNLPLDADVAERLARLQPPVSAPPTSDATLYIGWFNTKPIAAVWACGGNDARTLSGFGIHAATRGRSVLAQLADAVRKQENELGHRVLSSDDFAALDTDPAAKTSA
ncbi:acetyltransferase (GNAT) family protein [Paraperlucidibaca baekdonensis]|uniref:Acetyltransferase (GNAT) family protein n=1 Tax=Paraperlucidibaca baekdonensis TaxID=748120 RepID=A0A3E0H8N2_9GAMM|nr:acetyl-CoA sensor PanZ family protein [Paraperlucidibaca baekdonensis]REH40071.1 acetyltransferase (GNAT) family protein [Paraperlucidibaca baekdonensis]